MTEAHHKEEKWENLPIRKDAPHVRGGLGKANLTHPQIGAQEVVIERTRTKWRQQCKRQHATHCG